jgi:hypothetical protein
MLLIPLPKQRQQLLLRRPLRHLPAMHQQKGSGQTKLASLSTYVKASANNNPTDHSYKLGPPYDTTTYPFNQIYSRILACRSLRRSSGLTPLIDITARQSTIASQCRNGQNGLSQRIQFHRSILYGHCGIERECHVFRLAKCLRSIGLE